MSIYKIVLTEVFLSLPSSHFISCYTIITLGVSEITENFCYLDTQE